MWLLSVGHDLHSVCTHDTPLHPRNVWLTEVDVVDNVVQHDGKTSGSNMTGISQVRTQGYLVSKARCYGNGMDTPFTIIISQFTAPQHLESKTSK
jgi:hypothetical protein